MCERGSCPPSKNCTCVAVAEKEETFVYRYVWGEYKRVQRPCWKYYNRTNAVDQLESFLDKLCDIFNVQCSCTTKHLCDVCDDLTDTHGGLRVSDETCIELKTLKKMKSHFL
jgi:CRISPR/Cas system-associated protein Cas10 (large subunit of type III CRISPR-Cas system)